MLKFFYAPNSIALASHIALEEAGAPYQAVRLSLKDNDQKRPEYLAINPKGRVPSLVTEDGILTETLAILAYVAQTHRDAQLMPTEAFAFAQAQAFNSYLASTVHVAHAHKNRWYRWAETEAAREDLQRMVPRTVAEAFRLIETEYLQGPWVLGDRFSVCDGYLFTLSSWLESDGVDPAQFPRVLEHRERVAGRPAVQRALSQHQP